MGTVFALDIYAQNQQAAELEAEAAWDEVDRIEALLSNYQPASELSRLSRNAGKGPVTTDPETFAFLQRCLYWSKRSGGAFDITVGPLLRVWGFFFHNGNVPTEAELHAVQGQIGWQRIQLDAARRTVRFAGGLPMELDPGSIGKGYAVDKVVAMLRAQGVAAAFVDAGGSTLYGLGAPPGEPGWPVQIPDVRDGTRRPSSRPF